ncbi:16S rRNA (adenine(1518)-N(6)/adenine(1519)-N(6))-dimethyltransferase RsmA [Patescibacteria group bacterium]
MLHAKKSLGQNFLKSDEIVEKIIYTANVTQNDVILEIGPGKGKLTRKLLEKASRVIAVEKDDMLFEFLKEKFHEEIKNNKLELINEDILKFNLNSYSLKNKQYKIVANIPYYITGQLLRIFLQNDIQPSMMVLMLQKEVAERIITYKGSTFVKESLLSVSVKVYGEPVYIKTVPAKYFSPQPKVDSAILLIKNISKNFFEENKINEEEFFKFVKQGFSQKRKMLSNNLKEFSFNKEDFDKLKISPKVRAEDLSIEDWKNLYLNI